MLALTLWRPWDQLVVHAIKGIENREWQPEPTLRVGQRFAIHAGKRWDQVAVDKAKRLGITDETVRRFFADWPGHVVGVATLAGVVRESNDPWFFGPYGWVLTNAQPLPTPIPCRGFQKLWRLPPEVEAQVQRQLGAIAA